MKTRFFSAILLAVMMLASPVSATYNTFGGLLSPAQLAAQIAREAGEEAKILVHAKILSTVPADVRKAAENLIHTDPSNPLGVMATAYSVANEGSHYLGPCQFEVNQKSEVLRKYQFLFNENLSAKDVVEKAFSLGDKEVYAVLLVSSEANVRNAEILLHIADFSLRHGRVLMRSARLGPHALTPTEQSEIMSGNQLKMVTHATLLKTIDDRIKSDAKWNLKVAQAIRDGAPDFRKKL